MKNYAKEIIRPMMSYYFDRFHEENGILSNTIALFKSIRMFQPYFAKTEGVNATHVKEMCLKSAHFTEFEQKLIDELPAYIRLAASMEGKVEDVLLWMKQRSDEIPAWSNCGKIAALFQPSSGAAERLLGIVKKAVKLEQRNCLQDYVEMASIGCYNDHFHNSGYH
jgi:hypothetical protein